MKTKEEFDAVNKQFAELTQEELEAVNGGNGETFPPELVVLAMIANGAEDAAKSAFNMYCKGANEEVKNSIRSAFMLRFNHSID